MTFRHSCSTYVVQRLAVNRSNSGRPVRGKKALFNYICLTFCTIHFRLFSNYLKSRLYVYPKDYVCLLCCSAVPDLPDIHTDSSSVGGHPKVTAWIPLKKWICSNYLDSKVILNIAVIKKIKPSVNTKDSRLII